MPPGQRSFNSFRSRHSQYYFRRPMVGQQKRQALALSPGVNLQKSQGVGIDDLIGRFHGGKLEWLAALAAFARAHPVTKTLIDFEHVRERVMAAIFQLQQERGSGVDSVVR